MLRLYVLLAAYQTACCSTLSPSKKLSHSAFTRSASHFGTMPNGVKKENLPSKMCVTCNRPFTWRKKWERCWDEVSTCSKGCNAKRRALAKASGQTVSDDEEEGEEEDGTLKTAGTKKVPSKMDMIVKNAAIRTAPVKAHFDGDDSDDNEDNGVQAKGMMKSEKKLSRKKLQKLRMTQIPTEENNSKKADGDDDVSDDDDLEVEENAEEDEEEEKEKAGNAKKDKRLSKELLKLNMKISSVETSSTNKNSALKIDTDDDNNDDSGGEEANDGDEGDDEGEVKDTNESIKTEKKLSRKKLQKLKLKEAQGAEPLKDGPTERTKACAVCKENMTLLFRCQWDASKQWRFVCKFIKNNLAHKIMKILRLTYSNCHCQ